MSYILNLQQIAQDEWEFDYYNRHYVYYTNAKHPYTECYTADSSGVWIAPYICRWHHSYMPLDVARAEGQIEKFLCSGDVKRGKGLVYGEYGLQSEVYRSGEMLAHSTNYKWSTGDIVINGLVRRVKI